MPYFYCSMTPILIPIQYQCQPITMGQVWNVEGEGRKMGILVRTLVGHGHRINTLALSCEAALRTGPYGKEDFAFKASSTFTPEEGQAVALERYNLAR